jgi:hypothetical protein
MADLRDFTGKNRKFTGIIGEKISIGTTGERDTSFGAGTIRFNSTTALMEYYNGTEWKSIDAPPTITFITVDGGADTTNGQVNNESSGNVTIQVKGSLFDTTNGAVTFVGTSETLTPVTTTRNSTGLFTCVLPASSFDDANSPYTVKITNGSGLSAELVNGISADQVAPAFITSAGSLGTIFESTRSSYTLSSAAATDADGDTITYSISAGSLPAGLSFNTSTAAITGTASAVASNTTSTFTVSAATAASTSTRQFTITVNAPSITSFTSTGAFTYSVPVGVTSVRTLVVAGGGGGGLCIGGGGGAGGLVESSSFPVTPGGTVPGSVGGGGSGGQSRGSSGSVGGNSVFGSITANGGGGGGSWDSGPAPGGGSGGGGAQASYNGGSATQSPSGGGTGYGNPGWRGNPGFGGGGGAASSGGPTTTPNNGPGGTSRGNNITGSTVQYAGGGGGGAHQGSGANAPGGGAGAGGGGTGVGVSATANTGSGGGGSFHAPDQPGGSGGSGIVIVSI